jgi:hypothetical protein
LQLIHSQVRGFRASQTASDQQSQNCRISLPSQNASIGGIKQPLSLVACQPITDPPSKLSDSFNPADSSCHFGAQPTTLGGLIGQAPDRRKMKIYRGR